MGFEKNIPEGWVDTTLGEVAEVLMGQSPKGDTCNENGEGKPLLNGPTEFGEISPIPVQFTNDPKKISLPNDLLFCVRGSTTGRMNWSNQEYAIGRGIAAIRHKKGEEYRKYIKGIFDFKLQRLLAEATGSTFPNVSRSQLESIEINLPPLSEQKAIAKVLTAFDDKIELLQAQNKTLETMAQTIFKEWFGKYQIGDDLPEDWRVEEMRDLAEKISKGTTPRKKDVQGKESLTPFLKVKDITDDGLISSKNLTLIPKEVHNNQLKRSILESNDILFSIAGTIGRVAILNEELDDCNCNQAIAFIRLKNKNEFLEYVHLWIKSKDIQTEINSSIVQGVQANVSLAVLGDLKIILPSDSIMLKWKDIIKPIYKKIYNNNNQIQSLTKTRDTLLPKLMRGQVRVNNIKQTADA